VQGYSKDVPMLCISERGEQEPSTVVTWYSADCLKEFNTANIIKKKSLEIGLASTQLLRAVQRTGDAECGHVEATPQESAPFH